MKKCYGGVVINQNCQALLREPTNHHDNYVWTFAKGEPDPGESAKQTALREVREETGVVGEIVAEVPGVFPGGTSDNTYFLMIPIEDTKKFDKKETQSVRWVTQSQAEQLIVETTNTTGRKRDLRVLKAAFEVFERTAGQDSGS